MLLGLDAVTVPGHLLHREDLEVHRLQPVDDHVLLRVLVAEVDPIGVPRKEVDRGRAMERETALVHEGRQRPVATCERY